MSEHVFPFQNTIYFLTVVWWGSNGHNKYGFMDYLLNDKQSDKVFLSDGGDVISLKIKLILYRNALSDCLSLSK